MRFKPIFLALSLDPASLAQSPLAEPAEAAEAASGAELEFADRWDAYDSCYTLTWSYDSPADSPNTNRRPLSTRVGSLRPQGDQYVWYCQARPREAPTFGQPPYHAYQAERAQARKKALETCEKAARQCVTRCALAPDICRPHFWK